MVDCPSAGEQQVFLCQMWLADDEGDCLVERDLYETEDMRQRRKPSRFYFPCWLENLSNEELLF